MDFKMGKMFSKGFKGLFATMLAQVVTQIPDIASGIPLGDWGDMTVKGAVVALLVMLANYIKHKTSVKDSIKKVI